MNNNYESIPLDLWILGSPSEEEIRTVFLNMDKALKYIHEHGYCVDVFYPSEIEILNNELDHIQFKKLVELSKDPKIRRNMIQEDIFRSAQIQIGLYFYSGDLGLSVNDIFRSLTAENLKDNFDSYIQVVPDEVRSYYRGVILRGAHVYLCEFEVKKTIEEVRKLEEEVGDHKGNGNEMTYTSVKASTNNKINDDIYKQINGLKDAAFISTLAIPSLVLMVIIVLVIIGWIISIV